MRDLIGLRVRLLLLPPGLWERLDRKAPEEVHKADARRSLCSVCARDCSPLVRDTIVTQNASSAHNGAFSRRDIESSGLRFFARTFETLHARLLARFDGHL